MYLTLDGYFNKNLQLSRYSVNFTYFVIFTWHTLIYYLQSIQNSFNQTQSCIYNLKNNIYITTY